MLHTAIYVGPFQETLSWGDGVADVFTPPGLIITSSGFHSLKNLYSALSRWLHKMDGLECLGKGCNEDAQLPTHTQYSNRCNRLLLDFIVMPYRCDKLTDDGT